MKTTEKNLGSVARTNDIINKLLLTAVEKDLETGKIEKLIELKKVCDEQEAKRTFLTALTRFQANCPRLVKTRIVHLEIANGCGIKYAYADLGDITTAIKDILKECELSYRWEIEDVTDLLKVTCIVSHVDGHSERTSMVTEKDNSGTKNNIQARGSAITYLQRYTLIGALGIATANADVDGLREGDETMIRKTFDPETAIIGFGKYAGQKYQDLPADYLNWLAANGRPEEREKIKKLSDYLSVKSTSVTH